MATGVRKRRSGLTPLKLAQVMALLRYPRSLPRERRETDLFFYSMKKPRVIASYLNDPDPRRRQGAERRLFVRGVENPRAGVLNAVKPYLEMERSRPHAQKVVATLAAVLPSVKKFARASRQIASRPVPRRREI